MSMRRELVLLVVGTILFVVFLSSGCTEKAGSPQDLNKTVLKVVSAGSLLQPFAEAETAFEAEHPGVDVQIEGHGSIQAIRQVTDLHRPIDMVAVADASLIPDLMFRKDPATGNNFSDSFRVFAKNTMVIAYTNKSRYAGEITTDNWYEVLMRPDVRVGFSNPMLDAAGYRTMMVAMLADTYYHNETIFPVIIGDHFNPNITLLHSGDRRRVELPEVMKPADSKVVIRDGSMYVLSLLESGGIDYAIEYISVAEGHDLMWIDLPAEIDLSSQNQAASYNNVSVTLGFQRFSAIGQNRTGQPIVYALTVPNSAPHPELAQEFSDLVVAMTQKGGKGWPAPI